MTEAPHNPPSRHGRLLSSTSEFRQDGPSRRPARKLEAVVPKLDIGIAEALRNGHQRRVMDYEENGPRLSIFVERYHGARQAPSAAISDR
jgi:hypothetical protein